MNHLLAVLLFIFSIGSSYAAPTFDVAGDQYISPEVKKILALPEKKIDIALMALTLEKEIYPDLDIKAYSKKIDDLVQKVIYLSQNSQHPEVRIRTLNTVLHMHEGFHYDHAPDADQKIENHTLKGILDTHLGRCTTMPLLYIAVAQRAGYPLYPVHAPDHLFVRYNHKDFPYQNIETTSGGKYFPDDWYVKEFLVSERGLKMGTYLKTLSYREYMVERLGEAAIVFGMRGENKKSMAYLEMAVKLNPTQALHYDNLRIIYDSYSKTTTVPERAVMYTELAKQADAKAKDLGFVDPDEVRKARINKVPTNLFNKGVNNENSCPVENNGSNLRVRLDAADLCTVCGWRDRAYL